MKFYIQTIEQIKGEQEGTYSEYANVSKENTEEVALSKFYKKLSDVSAALGNTHVFMDIKIVNSVGGCIKKDSVGEYVEVPVD